MDCKWCASILYKYAKPHPKTPCPLIKSLYCGYCSIYGHTRHECPRNMDDSVVNEEPISIPYDSFVKGHEIMYTDSSIRALLLANDIVPMVCQEKGKKLQRDFLENKRRLLEFVNKRGETIIFIDS